MAFVPLIHRADGHLDRVAVVDDAGRFTYAELLDRSARAAMCLLDTARDLQEARVAFLVPPSMQHVVVQWGIWRAGGIAVPLCMQHPTPELEYTIDELAAETQVPSRTIRFYQSKKALPAPERRGRKAVYTAEHAERLH
ncbi:MAG: AMP-binding protein, partial [Arenicellales bacterium]|nr:AMP-binding protein [Arenicellales bacterium]